MAHDHCHCRDYTRSQLLHQAAAQAGKGLPTVETGMPLPAGTGLSRRNFLSRSAGLALAVYGATKLPLAAFEEGIANAATPSKVLVSIFFDGGIDTLNVLAPVNDSNYQNLRPTIGLHLNDANPPLSFSEDPNLYWHPSAAKLRTLHGEDKVTAFPAIGYTSPNQSHFTSRHYYEIGEVQVGANTGWLGRYIEQVGTDDNPLQGLSLSGELSPMLATPSKPVAAVDSVTDYNLWSYADSEPVKSNMFGSFGNLGGLASDSPAMTQARRATAQTEQVREDLAAFSSFTSPVANLYPNTQLSDQLSGLAAMLAAGLPIQVATMSATGGYDTHENEAPTLASNLQRTSDAVFAFQRDLEARGLDDVVLIEMWSEFGRRPAENGGGTDHGAGGLAFVVGKHAGGTMIGSFPGLASGQLDSQQNLQHNSDFRSMYCTLLENWLGVDATPIIPGASGFTRYAAMLD
jgi:uncharacterized protein (DUF1501 family)